MREEMSLRKPRRPSRLRIGFLPTSFTRVTTVQKTNTKAEFEAGQGPIKAARGRWE